jgi:hypothetical protein
MKLSSLRKSTSIDHMSLSILGDPGTDGRIILRGIFRKWDVGGMYSIKLAQDRDRWWALVTMVIYLWVP